MSIRQILQAGFTNWLSQTAAGNVTVVNEDVILVDKASGQATTVTLPAPGATGARRLKIVVDDRGDAATNAITVNVAGSGTINGATSYVINQNFGFAMFLDVGDEWQVVSGGGRSSQFQSGTAAFTSLNTAGNLTYSAAQLLTGTIIRDPNGGSRSDSLDTAANIVAAMPGCKVGDTITCYLVNGADAAETITVGAGSGGTFDANQIAASRIVIQNTSKTIKIRLTNVGSGTEAYAVCM